MDDFFVQFATGNYDEAIDILRDTFRQRFAKLREVARGFLKRANRNVWRCDTVVNNGMCNNGSKKKTILFIVYYADLHRF